jgi:hypothetical protein
MNFNLPSSKVKPFLPFLRTVLSKQDTILIGKYNYHIKKSFMTPILALRIENLTKFEECIEW